MEFTALKVTQPIGEFYITKISASDLLRISTSQIARYNEKGELIGNQRKLDKRRLASIANFIKTREMCFPTSIIVAVNIDNEGKMLDCEDKNRWTVSKTENDVYNITIPNDNVKTCVIIDGQHRLNAFESLEEQKDIELVCSLFFDLPNPYQAFLFATINGNQKPVSKSLSLDLYGYNLEHEAKDKWNPEKLAVSLTRKLNFNDDSPLVNCVKLAPNTDALPQNTGCVIVSTSSVASGILKLISKNPQKDRDLMAIRKNKIFADCSRRSLEDDGTVLRKLFLECKDDEIYSTLTNYFFSVKNILWEHQGDGSILKKTIGILVLFDILKLLLENNRDDYEKELRLIATFDYTDKIFSLSGGGRSSLYRVLRFAMSLDNITADDLRHDEKEYLGKYDYTF